MSTLKLDLNLVLPQRPADDETCIHLLNGWLTLIKGIEQVHITPNGSERTALLCIHYDPNLLTLARVERLALSAGARITNRYRHEQIPINQIDSADSAIALTRLLQNMPGMLHAQANPAAGLAFVAYDSRRLSHQHILQTIETFIPPKLLASKTSPQPNPLTQLPMWIKKWRELILVAIAGITFLIAWAGETFFALPTQIALVFYLLSYLAGGYDVAITAIPGLFKGKFDTDVLMIAAATGAAILGQWAEGAFLLFLFSLGHAGEHYALDRARNAVNALGELMPKTARVKRGEQIVEEAVENIQIADIVIVRPGDRVPVDGKVSSGASSIDQSPITGESVPVEKALGDDVFAGTINQDAALEVEVTKLAQDNTLSRVMKMVAEAQSQQSQTQQFTQRFMAWFVPTILITVTLVIFIPPLFGWLSFQESFYRAMLLLVGASPCALALGTPAAVLAGIAQAARNGVLIKGGVHLENLGAIKVMAFDKTGTLTEGKFSLTDIIPLNGTTPDALLQLAAGVEQQSNHPLALAVVKAAQAKNLALPEAGGLENIAGRGVRSVINGQTILIGSAKLFAEEAGYNLTREIDITLNQLEADGRTTMLVGKDNQFFGILGLADTPRPNVSETIGHLQTLGVEHLVMLTGDNQDVAKKVAAQIGLTDVRAELLPEDKMTAIKDLVAEYKAVAMTGDGVNDAPALATATVGIAMGGAGTAVALETADVALMGDDVSKLPFAVGLSRASRRIIRQNLIIALSVIMMLVITSIAGVMELSPAVIFHEGSTIVVVLNALRLLRYT